MTEFWMCKCGAKNITDYTHCWNCHAPARPGSGNQLATGHSVITRRSEAPEKGSDLNGR